MTQKLLLIAAWFPVTLILVCINLSLLIEYGKMAPDARRLHAVAPSDTTFQLAAGGTSQVLSAHIVAADARVYLVTAFLQKHKSPMAPYANLIVSEADRFGLDFRLVPAIAMCESNAGKHMPKKNEFNFAGIAVYTGQNNGKAFDSWEHAIGWISEYIKTQYYDVELDELREMETKWAPPAVENGHSWSNCVESFQNDII